MSKSRQCIILLRYKLKTNLPFFFSDEIDEQTLTVLIDNEESTLEFIDFSKHKVGYYL